MIKAVFVDYTGTTVKQTGKQMDEIIDLVQRDSIMKDRDEIQKFFYTNRTEREKKAYLDTYVSEDEIIDDQLNNLTQEYGLTTEHKVLKDLIHEFWKETPVYEDAIQFYNLCPLPIYVLTNNGRTFVSETLKKHQMKVTQIISSDDVSAYKPKAEIFEAALKCAGVSADEVIHVGDSWTSDILGARNVGIRAVLIDRTGNIHEQVQTIQYLTDLLPILKQ